MNESSCSCGDRGHKSAPLVVLTGGPGAGKTAVLEIAKLNLCEHVAAVPEAASIIFSGGFLRHTTLSGMKAAQRAIYYVQRESERLLVEERKAAILLCDRGTLDGLAYWPEDEDTFFRELGTDRKAELRRYHAVIHLRVPSAENGYNLSNPMRIESAEQAALIDKRIEHAWRGHPRRFFVESHGQFLEKVTKAIEHIRGELPECCKSPLSRLTI
jgi:predicted ATPase